MANGTVVTRTRRGATAAPAVRRSAPRAGAQAQQQLAAKAKARPAPRAGSSGAGPAAQVGPQWPRRPTTAAPDAEHSRRLTAAGRAARARATALQRKRAADSRATADAVANLRDRLVAPGRRGPWRSPSPDRSAAIARLRFGARGTPSELLFTAAPPGDPAERSCCRQRLPPIAQGPHDAAITTAIAEAYHLSPSADASSATEHSDRQDLLMSRNEAILSSSRGIEDERDTDENEGDIDVTGPS